MMKNYFFKVLVFIVSVCFMSFIPIEEHKIEIDNSINTPLETKNNFKPLSTISVDDMGCYVEMPTLSLNGTCVEASTMPNSFGDNVEFMWAENVNGNIEARTPWSQNTSLTYCPPSGGDYRLCARTVGCSGNSNIYETRDIHVPIIITPPSIPNCDNGDLIWTNSVTVNNDGSVNADVRFINGGNITIPGPYPAALTGPSVVNINEAISWDGYVNRVNVTQEFEQWRVVFLKNGVVQFSSRLTEDTPDRVASGEWIGALDQNINLPNGADQIVLAHIEDNQFGDGSRSSANSVVPSSICISVEGVTIEPPTPPTCDAGDFIWTNNVTVNNDGSVNAGLRFVNGGTFTIPGPYPAELAGPSVVNINEAVSWDGYASRVNVTQEFEQWRIVFLKDGAVQYSSRLTEDLPDRVAAGEWIGALDQNINLPNGADQIVLAHIEDSQFGDGSRSSANSVVPSSICISAEAICDLNVDTGDDIEVCEDETVELTATVENENICEGGCEYPIIDSVRCNNGNTAEIWISNAGQNYFNTTINSSFEVLDNGIATYSSRVSNGTDVLDVSLTFSGRTTTPPAGSPKLGCDTNDTSGYVYWTNTSGTIVSQQHGTFQVSRMGEAFQLGIGGDVAREGFGASGWLTITGGDGYYERGDINIKLGDCIPSGGNSSVEYVWTTEDGNIVGDANQATITVDQSGTYKVVAKDCKDCKAEDEVVVDLLEQVVIGDFVWVDENQNGLQDDGATGVNGINATLFQADGAEIARTTTDNNPTTGEAGYYEFEVCPDSGDYYIVFDNIPDGFEITEQNADTDDTVDSDINPNGRTDNFTVLDEGNLTIDAGIFQPRASLGDTVFLDEDQDGIKDPSEEGVEGVVVNLLDCDGNELDSTTTDANGNYSFTDLDPNVDYVVEFELPDGFEFSPADQGGDDAADSDAGDDGRTPCTDLEPGENNPTLDAGIFTPCTIDPAVTSVDPICLDTEVTLTASGGDVFQWEANGVVIDGETSASLTVTPQETTTYSVIITDSTQFECFAEVSTTVTVNPVTPDVVAETTVCEGAEFVWDFNGETYTEADSPVVLDLTDDNGCPYTATLTINEYPVTPDVVAETTVCEGAEFVWDFNGETYTAADSPVVLDLTDDNGCPYTATLTINEYPVTPDVVAETTVCEGAEFVWDFNGETYTEADSPVVLDLTDDNGCPYTATLTINEYPVTPDVVAETTVCEGAEFVWDFNGETYTAADSPVVLDLTDDNGCPYTATLTINEYPVTPDVVAETTVCEGAEFVWDFNGETYTAADSPVVLDLTDDNGCPYTATLTINEYPVTPDVVAETTVCEGAEFVWDFNGETYTAADSPVVLDLTDDNGCPYTATLTINEYPVTPDVVAETTVCEGAEFVWDFNGETYTAADSPVVLDLTDDNGCPYTATLTINEFDKPIVDAGTDSVICIGEEVTLTATGNGTFEWSTGETEESITVSPSETTTYSVTITSADGCTAEDSVIVTVDEKVTIGDFVFEDVNDNGIQDDGSTGVNGITVMLYNCSDLGNIDGTLVATTVTVDNPISGEPGFYSFEVCPNSGPYYIEFGDVPTGFEFTSTNIGDDALDSDPNELGVTDCFEVGDVDVSTIDAGIRSLCPLILQYKIRPRDVDGSYITGNETAACYGDDLVLRMVRPGQEDLPDTSIDFAGWEFTWIPADGFIAVRDNGLSRYGLDDEDFGTYTVSWLSPDGCEGSTTFTLNFPDEGCSQDGTRPSTLESQIITSVFPVPATSGSTLTIVINTVNGSIEGDSSNLNAVNFGAMLPANKENIGISLFDTNGRMVNPIRTYDITKGRDVVEYPLEYLSSGNYILKVDGKDWSDSKQVIIK